MQPRKDQSSPSHTFFMSQLKQINSKRELGLSVSPSSATENKSSTEAKTPFSRFSRSVHVSRTESTDQRLIRGGHAVYLFAINRLQLIIDSDTASKREIRFAKFVLYDVTKKERSMNTLVNNSDPSRDDLEQLINITKKLQETFRVWQERISQLRNRDKLLYQWLSDIDNTRKRTLLEQAIREVNKWYIDPERDEEIDDFEDSPSVEEKSESPRKALMCALEKWMEKPEDKKLLKALIKMLKKQYETKEFVKPRSEFDCENILGSMLLSNEKDHARSLDCLRSYVIVTPGKKSLQFAR